ncbi:MAG TPA: ribosomal protein S18-alanine N-acetyltransferase [Anaeromyxobacteraceae bacterium]|nr:ribosomal protein S18-alanine N-acetyltransferase [Anaeromyxobacteraceae bacterium]
MRPGSKAPALAFRRMRAADVPRIMEIERAAFSYPWSEDLVRRELTHEFSTVLLAAEPRREASGERILGFVISWLVYDELHVLNVAVAPEARRQGVARALLGEAEASARSQGARIATLEVRRSNRAAIALYRSLGYRDAGARPRYYADGEDALVMDKEM